MITTLRKLFKIKTLKDLENELLAANTDITEKTRLFLKEKGFEFETKIHSAMDTQDMDLFFKIVNEFKVILSSYLDKPYKDFQLIITAQQKDVMWLDPKDYLKYMQGYASITNALVQLPDAVFTDLLNSSTSISNETIFH